MATRVGSAVSAVQRIKKTTSIGKYVRSRPKNKAAKRGWKKYRGQGK